MKSTQGIILMHLTDPFFAVNLKLEKSRFKDKDFVLREAFYLASETTDNKPTERMLFNLELQELEGVSFAYVETHFVNQINNCLSKGYNPFSDGVQNKKIKPIGAKYSNNPFF